MKVINSALLFFFFFRNEIFSKSALLTILGTDRWIGEHKREVGSLCLVLFETIEIHILFADKLSDK